jgi:lipopolysaccharide/colanic/teichoic acid biosynthesis glycosyltransferase
VDVHRQDISNNNSPQAIPPGITAWAQIQYKCGCSVDDAKEKLCCDLFYIKNIVARRDLLVSLQAINGVMWARGAK